MSLAAGAGLCSCHLVIECWSSIDGEEAQQLSDSALTKAHAIIYDAGARPKIFGAIQNKPSSTGTEQLLVDQLIKVPDTTVPPAWALVVLVCFYMVEEAERGRVVAVTERRGLSVGFQVEKMPKHVLTAGHCVERLRNDTPGAKVLSRGEASVIYALGFGQFKKMSQAQWYDVSVLEQFGAQQVLSFKSEFPSSGQLLEGRFEGNVNLYGEVDVALLRLAGPLSGVVGLPLAPWTTKFRPGALFLAMGTPDVFETNLGVYDGNPLRIPIYSANQDLMAQVTLAEEASTFEFSSVTYPGFSGGPICARIADVVPPSFFELLARPILAFLPMVELPPEPRRRPTMRKAGDTVPAVDPVTGEALGYPTGELASPTLVRICSSRGLCPMFSRSRSCLTN
jgi:hypothetical protein